MSLIEKIDAMKVKAQRLIIEPPHDSLDEIANDISEGYITACNEIRDYVLSEQKEPLTIGDRIRESNESLAEYLFERYLSASSVLRQDNMKLIMNYLNQPSNGTE